MRMKTAGLVVTALLILASAAWAAPVQRIWTIREPLLSVPALVKAGDGFRLVVKPDAGRSVVAAYLDGVDDPNVHIPLGLNTAADNNGFILFTATVPGGTPAALYDLSVRMDDNSHDYQPHAVDVVKQFDKDFDFVQITDIHFNVQDIPGKDMSRIRKRLLQDLNKTDAEFVILTGDLNLDPETYYKDYIKGYEDIVEWVRKPMFIIPGNHEQYVGTVNGAEEDGVDYWTATYGPRYHSFNYGPVHFVGINSFDWPKRWRVRRSQEVMFSGTLINAFIGQEQWDMLQKDLAASSGRGDKCIAYTHIPIETLQGGKPVGIPPNQWKAEGPNTQEFVDLMKQSGCSYLFVGHMHYDQVNKFDGMTEVLTRSAGISITEMERGWGYRIIHVRNGAVTGWDDYTITFDDLAGGSGGGAMMPNSGGSSIHGGSAMPSPMQKSGKK